MSKLKIYGIARSRAFRTLWMAAELGLDYENVPVSFADGGTQSASFLAVNPNGRIPAIDDDGFRLWESAAINLYLAKKHSPGKLYPTGAQDEARVWQWSFWAVTELETPVITCFLNRVMRPPEQRDAAAADAAEKQLARPLKVLDGALAASPHLLGSSFTVADLNVAGVLSAATIARVDLAPFPNVARWLKSCMERPAVEAARTGAR